MKRSRKTVLIKATSSTGSLMSSNAEYHTLFYFCKWLSKECNVIVSGIEFESPLIKKLGRLNVNVKVPYLKYLFLGNFKLLFHIPVSVINTFIDVFKFKPDLLICLGGVFYNGVAILIAGKIFGIKTVVRSAEDHEAIASYKKEINVSGIYAKLRAFLSRITIKNSDYFLTVGNWSLNYFVKTYALSPSRCFMVPGPVDNSITNKKDFKKSFKESKNYLNNKYGFSRNEKVILFVGSEEYKGTKKTLHLIKELKKNNLNTKIMWISNSKKIINEVKLQKLDQFVIFIDPVGRCELVKILKGVDFLFWSTSLGVGYGQILLESILCGTEILCYLPIGDAKSLVKNNYYKSINEIIQRLNGEIQSKRIDIPKWMEELVIANDHLKFFRRALD